MSFLCMGYYASSSVVASKFSILVEAEIKKIRKGITKRISVHKSDSFFIKIDREFIIICKIVKILCYLR